MVNRELALHFALRSDNGVEVGILGGDIVVRRAGWLARCCGSCAPLAAGGAVGRRAAAADGARDRRSVSPSSSKWVAWVWRMSWNRIRRARPSDPGSTPPRGWMCIERWGRQTVNPVGGTTCHTIGCRLAVCHTYLAGTGSTAKVKLGHSLTSIGRNSTSVGAFGHSATPSAASSLRLARASSRPASTIALASCSDGASISPDTCPKASSVEVRDAGV